MARDAEMKELLESYDGYQQRSVERCHVLIETQLRVDGELTPFEVLNISTAGFMGRSPLSLLMGAVVEIDLPGLDFVPAHIRWSLADQVGVQFARGLTLDECRRAILPDPEDRRGPRLI